MAQRDNYTLGQRIEAFICFYYTHLKGEIKKPTLREMAKEVFGGQVKHVTVSRWITGKSEPQAEWLSLINDKLLELGQVPDITRFYVEPVWLESEYGKPQKPDAEIAKRITALVLYLAEKRACVTINGLSYTQERLASILGVSKATYSRPNMFIKRLEAGAVDNMTNILTPICKIKIHVIGEKPKRVSTE